MAAKSVVAAVLSVIAILSCVVCTSEEKAQFKAVTSHAVIRRHGGEKHEAAPSAEECGEGELRANCKLSSARGPCTVTLRWATVNSSIIFNIVTPLDSSGGADRGRGSWVAVGFSHDSLMANSDSLECLFLSNGSVSVLDGWNNDVPTNTVDEDQSDIELIRGSTHNNMGNCSFRRTIVPHNPAQGYFLNQSLHILLAIGPLKGSKVLDGSTPLAHHTWKQALSEQVNIVASCDVPPPSKEMWRSVLIRIHGTIMTFIVLVVFPLGAIVARYFREVLGTRWIKFHMGMMISGVLSMIVGLMFALGHTSFQFHVGVHQVLGIILIPVTVVQVVVGLFRPHPGKSTKRIAFNWVHRCTGVGVFLVGCELGVSESKQMWPPSLINVNPCHQVVL
jgi:hypothetical protein